VRASKGRMTMSMVFVFIALRDMRTKTAINGNSWEYQCENGHWTSGYGGDPHCKLCCPLAYD